MTFPILFFIKSSLFPPFVSTFYGATSLLPLCGGIREPEMLFSVQKAESPKRVYFVKYKNLFYLYIIKYTFCKIILLFFVNNRTVAMPRSGLGKY